MQSIPAKVLPADGKQLVQTFETEVEEIQREAERKIEARREALAKEFEALQDKYTKAGQLDDAIAVREYLRAGLPGKGVVIRRGPAIRKGPARGGVKFD